MGIHIIKMPDIGEGIAEVELVEWHVQPGDTVEEDQLLADVMTDKATVDVPSPVTGTVVSLGGAVGEVMAVGAELIRIEVEGAGNEPAAPPAGQVSPPIDDSVVRSQAPSPIDDSTASGDVSSRTDRSVRSGESSPHTQATPRADARQSASARPDQAVRPASPAPTARHNGQQDDEQRERGTWQEHETRQAAAPAGQGAQSGPVAAVAAGALREPGEKPLASPAVRQRAADLGIDLRYVPATGGAGQITHADLDAYAERGAAPPAAGQARGAGYAERNDEHAVPVIGLRRKIAQKMQEAKRRIPHFSYVEEVDVTELEALRAALNKRWGQERGKLTLLPFLIRAVVLAVRPFPQVNARFDDEAGVVTQYGAVHMGVAAQTDAGLMVPVLRHAEALDLWETARQVARLADEARTGRIAREEVSGSTITITSLGPLGGIVSTPVINHPEVAIVGINRMVPRPVVIDGTVAVRKMMNLSSSFDHRVVDGMHAAEFIQAVRGYLECPATLFVE